MKNRTSFKNSLVGTSSIDAKNIENQLLVIINCRKYKINSFTTILSFKIIKRTLYYQI